MSCRRCNGRMHWKDRTYTTQGEDPGYWRCISCGEVVYPDRLGLKKEVQNIPSPDSGEKGGQKIMTEETKICINPKCPKSNPQPLSEFNKNARHPSGREYKCRTCTTQQQRDWIANKKKATGKSTRSNGRRKSEKRQFVTRAGHPLPILTPSPPIQGIYLDPAVIKAIQKSAAKQIMKDFSEFIEERYS